MFITLLLDAICPKASIPDTIQTVVKRLRSIPPGIMGQISRLPGSYPPSTLPSVCDTTTSETSWLTTSEGSGVTVVSYIPSIILNPDVRVVDLALINITGSHNSTRNIYNYRPQNDLTRRLLRKAVIVISAVRGFERAGGYRRRELLSEACLSNPYI